MLFEFCLVVLCPVDTRLKTLDSRRNVMAPNQNVSDSEGRKLGERTGLDTPVVPAVNDADCGVASDLICRSAVA